MTKIVLAQIDSYLGNIEKNTELIISNIKKAQKKNAKLIIFPKFALIGYPIKNLLERHKTLILQQEMALKEIAQYAKDITVVLGYADKNSKSNFVIIKNGEIIKNKNTFLLEKTNYQIADTYKSKTAKDIDTVIHIDATPSRLGSEFDKNRRISNIVQKAKVNYIYVNKVGYSDNLCFDGASRIYDKNCNITALAKSFEEDFLECDNLDGKINKLLIGSEKRIEQTFNMNYENDLDRLYKELICGIKGYFKKSGFQKAVLGLSGGLDSTICAVLLADALGKENVVAISMPTKISSQGSKNDAKMLAQNLGISYIESPINNETEIFTKELKNIFNKINMDKYETATTFENIQARTRATLLWSIANEYKGMLTIATSDKSEAYIGYATTNGDMSGGFAPIADVTKTKLFALADYLNNNRKEKNVIPNSILEKPPGAELKFDKVKGRTITAEEDNMPYPFLDEIIWLLENKNYGYEELLSHKFYYEKSNKLSLTQKKEWIEKFYRKMNAAVFKWHILPPSIITDKATINQSEYYQAIL